MKHKNPRKRKIRSLSEADLDGRFEISARLGLAMKLNELIEEKQLSQYVAADIIGMPQPKISAIRNYKLQGISLERLMQALTALDQKVEIVISPADQRTARIRVAA